VERTTLQGQREGMKWYSVGTSVLKVISESWGTNRLSLNVLIQLRSCYVE
jgi:hypothetical protein